MIFINYRKADSQAVVDNLAKELKKHFGADAVFKDDQDIGGGEKWPDRLRQAVLGCDVLLAVVGDQWLTVHDEHGRRRIDDEADWVRQEIVTALDHGKRVLPLLVGAATMPPVRALSGNPLRPLADLHFLPLRPGRDFDNDVVALVRELSPRVPAAPPLPSKPPVCFGRDKELARLVDLLAPPNPAATATATPVAGVGGIGKSNLVLTALHHERVAARYGDRRHFVRLDGAGGRAGVVAATAEAFGLALGDKLESRLMDFLQSAGPRLLVLDNAETPLLAGPEARVETEDLLEQLAQVPRLTLAATLRPGHPLGPGWGAPFEVRRIDDQAARAAFLANTSGRFADDPALDALLHELDGWPLAVTLLAYQARFVVELQELADAWRTKRTALLSKGVRRRDADLGASIELSLGNPQMTEGARRLLSLLGLLPDGVRRADLAELLPPDGLGAASSLRRVGGVAFDEGLRLRVLAPLRDYLAANHPPSDEDRERAVRFYCTLADGEGNKAGYQGGQQALARLAAEAGNLVAMIRLGLGAPDLEPAVRAAFGVGEFTRFSGVDLTGVIRFTLQCARDRQNVRCEADCLSRLGRLALSHSLDEAGRCFEGVLRLGRRVGDPRCEANGLFGLGEIAWKRMEFDEAGRLYEQALPLYRQAGYAVGEGNSIHGMAESALGKAQYDDAERLCEQALPVFRSIGSLLGLANCFQSLGKISLGRGDHAEATRRFEEAKAVFREAGDTDGEAECLRGLGDVAQALGNPAAARRRYEEALALFAPFADPYQMARIHHRLARVTESDERRRQVRAARDWWVRANRPDLVAQLDQEFGERPTR